EREHVAVDDPLQAADADAQRRLDVGERDAVDRVMEEGEEQDRAEGREGRSSRVTLPEQRERAHAEKLRLAGGRRAALQRDESAEARVPDLPRAVLAYGCSRLLGEPRRPELDGVDHLRLVRAFEPHRGNRYVDVLRKRVA